MADEANPDGISDLIGLGPQAAAALCGFFDEDPFGRLASGADTVALDAALDRLRLDADGMADDLLRQHSAASFFQNVPEALHGWNDLVLRAVSGAFSTLLANPVRVPAAISVACLTMPLSLLVARFM